MLTFGACSPALLQPEEPRAQALVGLEDFLQRVQLQATGLLLSEAMAGIYSAGSDEWFSRRIDETSGLELRRPDIARKYRDSGAGELLKRFELHPSPQQKMRALLALERLLIAHLSAPALPQPIRPTAVHTASTRKPLSVQTKGLSSGAGSAEVASPTPLSPNEEIVSKSIRRQASDLGSSGKAREAFQPMSLRGPTGRARRRALSIYADEDDGRQDEESSAAPSIHDLLASFTSSPAVKSTSGGKKSSTDEETVSMMSATETDNTAESSSPTSTTHHPLEKSSSGPKSTDSATALGWYRAVDPPNTDQVVNALETVLLDADCRPADLFLNLQLVGAFTPTSVLDMKDEVRCATLFSLALQPSAGPSFSCIAVYQGKAMWDVALAALSLKHEAAVRGLADARAALAQTESKAASDARVLDLLRIGKHTEP